MPRITIDLPEQFVFETSIQLKKEHINVGNHLDNAILLSLVTNNWNQFWSFINYQSRDFEGLGHIVADVAAEYKSQGFPGETLLLEMACKDYHKYGFDLVWQLSEHSSGREIARGKYGMLCFDYREQKVVHLPDKLKKHLHSLHSLK